MLVKFLKSTDNAKGIADYLQAEIVHDRDPVTGKNLPNMVKRSVPPEHLRGDFSAVVAMANALEFSNPYTVGLLAFERSDAPTDAQIQEMVDSFERHCMGGLEADRALWAWNIHRDKGNVELNFMVANVDLKTGRMLNIAPPGYARFMDSWRDYQNAKHGWADPNDPTRGVESKTPRGENKDRSLIRLDLHKYVQAGIAIGNVSRDRAGVIALLNEVGTVTKVTKQSISVVVEGQVRPIRMKGTFYEQDFTFGAEDSGSRSETKPPAKPSLGELRERLEAAFEGRRKHNQHRYKDRVPKPNKGAGNAGPTIGSPNAVVDLQAPAGANDHDAVSGVLNGRWSLVVEQESPSSTSAAAAVASPEYADEGRENSAPSSDTNGRLGALQHGNRAEANTTTMQKGSINESAYSETNTKLSMSGLHPRTAHGLPSERHEGENRHVLQVNWQTARQRPASGLQRLLTLARSGVNYAYGAGKSLARHVATGFENIRAFAGFAAKVNEWVGPKSVELGRCVEGFDRAGKANDHALQRLGRAIGGSAGRARNLAPILGEIEQQIERTLNPEQSPNHYPKPPWG